MNKAKKVILFLFVVILLLDIYLFSFRNNIIIQIFFLVFLYGISAIKSVPVSFLKILLPLVVILTIGFVGSFSGDYQLTNIIKDILHMIKPIVGLSIGYFVFKIIGDYRIFVKTIVLTGFLTASIHLISVLVYTDFLSVQITAIRGKYFLDNFLEMFAFIMLVFSPKDFDKPLFRKKAYHWTIMVVLAISILIYFSRAMFVVIFIMALSTAGFTRINARSLKILGILMVVGALFYAYLFSIKLDRNSKGLEGFMYKIKIAPSEILNTKIDRENHRDLWDHWRGYEAKRALALMEDKPGSYIFGAGYGSLVNLKFIAPLGENGMKFISVLHNGYVFVFYKTGILGLVFLFVFLIRLYLYLYKEGRDKRHTFILNLLSTIGLFYMFSSLIITGIYIAKDSVIFILGGLLHFERESRLTVIVKSKNQ